MNKALFFSGQRVHFKREAKTKVETVLVGKHRGAELELRHESRGAWVATLFFAGGRVSGADDREQQIALDNLNHAAHDALTEISAALTPHVTTGRGAT